MIPGKPALLVITSTYPRWPGDSEPAFVHQLCQELAGDYNVHVVAPHAPGADTTAVLGGVAVHRFRYLPEVLETLAYAGGIPARIRGNPLRLLQVPFFVAGQLLAALNLAWSLRPVAIHAHWIVPQGVVALLVRALTPGHPPVLCTVHGADLYALRSRTARAIKSWVLRRSDRVTVVGAAMLDEVAALGANNATVAPMGVDMTRTFTPVAGKVRDGATAIFVGRLVEKKGVHHLVRAFAAVGDRLQSARLFIIGGGPERQRLERQVQAAGLAARVEFTGAIPQADIAARLRTATVAVFPFVESGDGDREGLGLALVEAQACECPVVAYDVPAVRATVSDGETGLLAAAGDANALASAMLRVMTDPVLAGILGRNGRAAARQNFSWEVSARRYRDLIANMSRSREPEPGR